MPLVHRCLQTGNECVKSCGLGRQYGRSRRQRRLRVLPRDVGPVGSAGGEGPQLVKNRSNLVEDIGLTGGFRGELGCKRVGIEAHHGIGVVGELPLGGVEGGPKLVVDEIAILPDQVDGRGGQRLLAVGARCIKRREYASAALLLIYVSPA